MRTMTGAMATTSLCSDAGTSLLIMHCCVREAHDKCGEIKLCYVAGVAAGAAGVAAGAAGVAAGAAGVAAGAAAGAAVVPSDDAGVEELVDVDEVDAGVVLLVVDLLSVL